MADFVAERVVVELLGKTEQFDRAAVQSATGFDASMKKIEASAKSAEATVARSSDARIAAIRKESAQISAAAKLLSTQLTDIGHLMNGPNSPFVIPQKQAPAASRAFALLSAGGAALGGVIGGVLTTAVIAYVASLAEMIFKTNDAEARVNELVEKLKAQAQQSRDSERATALFDKSLEGVRKAADDAERAIQALKKAQKSQEEQTVESIRTALNNATAIRIETAALIEAAKAYNERFKGSLASTDPRFASEFQVSSSRIERLEKDLKEANAEAARLEKSLISALSQKTVRESARTEEERINKLFDSRIESARQEAELKAEAARKAGDQAKAERIVGAELKKQTDELNRQRRLKLDSLRKQPKVEIQRETGGSLTSEQARSIVNAQFGANAVSSGRRSAERNKDVGGVPNSFHLTGNAIDVRKVAGVTLNKLKSLISAQGVIIEEALDEGDHFHIAWRSARTQAERLAEEQKRLADQEEARARAYDNERAGMEDSVLDAKAALVVAAEEITKLELQAIEISRQKYADDVAHREKLGKLREDEAAELLKLNEERAKLRKEAVQRREDERKFRLREAEALRKVERQSADIATEQELLESRAGLARTARQRHDLEARLIDLTFDEERLQLQATIAGAERLRIEMERLETLRALSDEEKAALQRAQDQAKIAQDRLATQDERRANAQTGNDQANAGPLQDMFRDVPRTAEEANEAFERIAAGGLSALADGITDVITGTKSLGEAFRGVAQQIIQDIIQMTIRMLIFKAISAALGFSEGGAVGSPGAPTGNFIGPRAAGGGHISGPGTGTSDSIPAWLSDGEFVIRRKAVDSLGVPLLEHLNRTGKMPRFADGALARRGIRPSNAAAVAPRGAGGSGFSQQDIAQLRGIIGEAINAMPTVEVAATFDPDEAIARALRSSRTSKGLLAWMGDNRGAVNGTLQGP